MERSGHSPLGIASFCISLLGSFTFLLWLLLAGIDADETLIGSIMFLQLFVSAVGAGLGIGPLFSTSKRRGFAIAGVVIGVATFVITLGILGIGLWALSTGMVD